MLTTNTLPVPGRRVVSATGLCGNVRLSGIVLCHIEDRWGSHAVVLMDDGTTRKCHGLANGAAIGWHAK